MVNVFSLQECYEELGSQTYDRILLRWSPCSPTVEPPIFDFLLIEYGKGLLTPEIRLYYAKK